MTPLFETSQRPAPHREHPPLSLLKKALILALWLSPALCAFQMMAAHWVSVPHWDEWDMPGAQLVSYYRGTFSFTDLFSQHNEHRMLFPRLVYLLLAMLGGWDVRQEMALTFCFLCFGSAGIYKLLCRSRKSATGCALGFGLANLFLFSPRQIENLLWGAQGATFVPTFALIFAVLVNLSTRSLQKKTIMNAALAFVSTYSFGNGMLVWLLAFPLNTRPASDPSEERSQIWWRAAYVLAAAASVAAYFISYQHPPLAPPLVSPPGHLKAVLQFVLIWLGALFSVGNPVINGAIVLLLFLSLATAALRRIWRMGRWQPHYPWLVLGCYVLISGCLTAIARVGFPFSMAADARYAAFTAFFYIAVVGLGFSVCQEMANRGLAARIAKVAAVISLALVITLWAVTYKKERKLLRTATQERKHSQLVVRWSAAISRNPEIRLLSPYQETANTIRVLAEHDALRPRLVSASLASSIHQPPLAGESPAGMLEKASRDTNGRLLVRGWARVPNENRAADCVVVGFETSDGTWTPFCVFETGARTSDQRSAIAAREDSGFFGNVQGSSLPPGDITVKSWAIDLENERAFPMAGAVKLEASR